MARTKTNTFPQIDCKTELDCGYVIAHSYKRFFVSPLMLAPPFRVETKTISFTMSLVSTIRDYSHLEPSEFKMSSDAKKNQKPANWKNPIKIKDNNKKCPIYVCGNMALIKLRYPHYKIIHIT